MSGCTRIWSRSYPSATVLAHVQGLPAGEFSLQPSVSRPGLGSREASVGMTTPNAGQRHTPPGGGFTVTTGIDARQHSTHPLQVGCTRRQRPGSGDCHCLLLPDRPRLRSCSGAA
jgi:hypothetical protein